MTSPTHTGTAPALRANNLYPNLLADGSLVGSYDFQASDGVNNRVVARIIVSVDGTSVPGQPAPTSMSLWTTDANGNLVAVAVFGGSKVAPGFRNWNGGSVTDGTDTDFASGTAFFTSVFIPTSKVLTGIGFLMGSVGGTDKVVVQLHDDSGLLLANSTLTGGGTTAGTAAQTQKIPFTSTYQVYGPAMYYIGVSANGNTAKLLTVPAYRGAELFAGSVSQTAATPAAITPPTTFTADKAPIAFVY